MKRLMGAMMAVALLVLCAAGAAGEPLYAADGSAVSGRIDFTEGLAPYAGKWVNFQDGFRLYLPQDWERSDVSDAQAQAGLFYRETNNGSDSVVGELNMGVAVSYADANGLQTLDELAALYTAGGLSEVDKLDLNGLPVVTFASRGEDYRGVAFFHPIVAGYVMTIYVSPCGVGDRLVNDVGSAVLCSLTPRT